jgi:hypothetical protein
LPRWLVRSTLAVAHLSEAPDLIGLGLGDRPLVALGGSQLRWRSRPVIMTRSPLVRESARVVSNEPGRAEHASQGASPARNVARLAG